LGENINTIQKNTEALLDAGKEVGLEVNSEKTKYMLMSCKKAGQKHSIKIMNRSLEGVAKFKYLGTTLTDQNCMQEEIKSRLNSGNVCYHFVQSVLSSRLLSRNVKVKIHKTIIVPVVLHGCETWSIMFRVLFWDILPCKMIVDRRFSETLVNNHFTWQYIPEENSEHHTRRRENLKSHLVHHIKGRA
jgi:hypothetical protein